MTRLLFLPAPPPNRIMQVLAWRPNGPTVNSQGREPLVSDAPKVASPNGAKLFCRPFGAFYVQESQPQGLTPLAIDDRRVAAWASATSCIILQRGRSWKFAWHRS